MKILIYISAFIAAAFAGGCEPVSPAECSRLNTMAVDSPYEYVIGSGVTSISFTPASANSDCSCCEDDGHPMWYEF